MKRLLMLKSMMKRITIAIVSSPQHFCFIAAIEYPMKIMNTDISSAGLHHVRISIFMPKHSLSIFTLNHKYSISIKTTATKGMNSKYNLRWVLISIRFIWNILLSAIQTVGIVSRCACCITYSCSCNCPSWTRKNHSSHCSNACDSNSDGKIFLTVTGRSSR